MTDPSEIFGPKSKGETLEDRARSSALSFVRSHMQLALDSPEATGRRLTALEALETFGPEALKRVIDEGGMGIVSDSREPARTIAERRTALRLSKRALATAANVTTDDITAAETPGAVVPIRKLENIAQALALDERQIGLANALKGDRDLVARLRQLRSDEHDDSFVTQISEAAWVIARQAELSTKLKADRDRQSLFSAKSGDYSGQIWRKGYDLAERTRRTLGLDPQTPIDSVYALAQDDLGIPVVNVALEEGLAGATILNGSARGVVLNTQGVNGNILVRRMTLAHELGHLLWDPDSQLERVRVDEVVDLRRRDISDTVEARANAFAVAFLTPRSAVRHIYTRTGDAARTVAELVEDYGVSAAAAGQHLANVCNLSQQMISGLRGASRQLVRAWEERESQNDLIRVPQVRGGRFALLTLQAVRKSLISVDTAASWLRIEKRHLASLF
jgi:Zn-dependent peptidase ImmA (M78 family)/transcriptional regulator with XRE-family HTH domain